ncbi:MAG TPA: SDR family oxidoreductase [Steroidobacteraceae bacterium]|nr:SDR family oxidoreductase [Steroidobacteraceae bacterium]
MKDKIAIVTGASSGIGAATAELLAREGALVAAVARRADRLEQLVRRIEAAGGRAAAFPADIAIDAEAAAVAERVLARYGRIDILVNGAGIVRPGAVETSDPAHWREMIDINLLASMYLSRAVLPGMRARGDGHIVIVSSTAGRYVGTRHSGYTASKHAVNAFAETMRQEVAPHGIRVTIVEPGATTTEVASSIPDAEDRAAMVQHVTKEGSMRAEDVGGAVLFALRQPPYLNVREIWLAPTAALR